MQWKRWAIAVTLAAMLALASYELGVRSGDAPGKAADRISVPAGDPAAAAPGSARFVAGAAAAAAAVADVLALPTDFARTHAAYALAAGSDEAALPALIASARQLEAPRDRRILLGALIARMGEIDPARALDHIAGVEPGLRVELLDHFFTGWAGFDLDAAIAAVSGLDTAFERRVAGDAILVARAAAGQQELAAITARLGRPPGSTANFATTLAGLAMEDPVTALEEAAGLEGEVRLAAIAEIGRSWALTDPEAAYAHVRTLRDPTLRNQLLGAVLYTWSESEPARVIGLLAGELDDYDRNAVLNMGVAQVARREPQTAHALVQELQDASQRVAALQRVFGVWAQQDPAAASAALGRVAAEDMSNLPALVGYQYALHSPAEALAWAARFDDGFGAAMRNVVPEVARRDAPLALATAYALPDVDDRNRAVTSILATVAAEDPEAATSYWQQAPVELRADAAARIVSEWRSEDPGAAAEWLLGLPRGAERDAGLRMLVVTGPQATIDIPRLVNAIESTAERDRLGRNYIRNVLIEGELRRAEAELSRLDFSPAGRREAQRLIDAAQG